MYELLGEHGEEYALCNLYLTVFFPLLT